MNKVLHKPSIAALTGYTVIVPSTTTTIPVTERPPTLDAKPPPSRRPHRTAVLVTNKAAHCLAPPGFKLPLVRSRKYLLFAVLVLVEEAATFVDVREMPFVVVAVSRQTFNPLLFAEPVAMAYVHLGQPAHWPLGGEVLDQPAIYVMDVELAGIRNGDRKRWRE
ncbi:hypothetical protein FN846DRAFT_513647 [Sphaerosporella brunnea]|uniref:Uncharacterized protein n=1 Tax=Sphaerosporella brunnea TaxID=1250544 RepID=A0A5J5EF23_9PEZI|nr:hypothetical protein FN846DRAFT_513647 [Sphaerosporella brunnea]